MSRKVVLYIATSLDGYIARANGDVDWLSIVEDEQEDYGYNDLYHSIDTALMGRKTYEQILQFGEFPYKGKRCYVISTQDIENTDDVIFVHNDVGDFLRSLTNEVGSNIWLIGGAELIKYFYENDLIDEYIISIIPVVLGEGIPLFIGCRKEQKLELTYTETYASGLVQVHYKKR